VAATSDGELRVQPSLYRSLGARLYYALAIAPVLEHLTRSKKNERVALAPANALTQSLLGPLRRAGFVPLAFDRNLRKPNFPGRIQPYSRIRDARASHCFVLSPLFGKEIEREVLAAGMPRDRVHRLHREVPATVSIDEAADLLSALEVPAHTRRLRALVGERRTAVILGSHHFDVREKVAIIRRALSCETIWVDDLHEGLPRQKPKDGVTVTTLADALNYVRQRRRQNNVLFVTVQANQHNVMPFLLRRVCPDAAILPYMYDWLHLCCPPKHADVFLRNLHWLDAETLRSEYDALGRMLQGAAADGILHKDGGPAFPVLKSYRRPSFFFPPTVSRRLYQPPPPLDRHHDHLVFIGGLYSPSAHPPEMFDDVFFFDIFRRMAAQGLKVTAYDNVCGPAILAEYQAAFPSGGPVSIRLGARLSALLPKIAGRYDWGYMLHDSEYRVVHEHIKHGLPAKVFTYAALGIPIAVSAELRFVAEWVKAHGIGVVIRRRDLDRTAQILAAADYAQLQRNVLAFRTRHSSESYAPQFAAFVRQIMARPHGRSSTVALEASA
jgi:hypothetical protein